MENPIVSGIIILIGIIVMVLATWWVSRLTAEEEAPPELTQEQKDALTLLEHSMIQGHKIQSHIRITTKDGCDIFFRLESPDKVKIEMKKTSLRAIKNKI